MKAAKLDSGSSLRVFFSLFNQFALFVLCKALNWCYKPCVWRIVIHWRWQRELHHNLQVRTCLRLFKCLLRLYGMYGDFPLSNRTFIFWAVAVLSSDYSIKTFLQLCFHQIKSENKSQTWCFSPTLKTHIMFVCIGFLTNNQNKTLSESEQNYIFTKKKKNWELNWGKVGFMCTFVHLNFC